MAKKNREVVDHPPWETVELRRALTAYLDQLVDDPVTKKQRKLGNFRWGVYVFYDYDAEPIYVGQTLESIRTRVGRHLTNQRTDAVAMSVLDPFEVFEIEVWPLAEFQASDKADTTAKSALMALERQVYDQAIAASKFKAILNEKDPPKVAMTITLPKAIRGSIVTEKVRELRGHLDVRIARRALTISRLAQVISERKVQGGLRRTLSVQANRLHTLAQERFVSLGGDAIVGVEDVDTDMEENRSAE